MNARERRRIVSALRAARGLIVDVGESFVASSCVYRRGRPDLRTLSRGDRAIAGRHERAIVMIDRAVQIVVAEERGRR